MATPFNIRVMDTDKFITENRLSEVTSTATKIATSMDFDPDGLFSESIFGEIGTLTRATTHGYINLKAPIIAPVLYKVLKKLGDFYVGIMSGKIYAKWNEKEKNFEKVFGDPEDTPGANTGFNFFMQHYPKLQFAQSNSLRRETKLDLLEKYRKTGIYTKYLVEPAAIRDVQLDDTGRLVQDDINTLYVNLLAYARGLPDQDWDNFVYDPLRFNIQSKAVEIYDYIENMMTGKKGFLQGTLSARKITLGTRNVITAASYTARTPDDPQALQPDETALGVFQCAKAFQPLVFYYLKQAYITPILGEEHSSSLVPLVNPKTLNSEYIDIGDDEKIKWTSSDGINAIINRFQNIDTRHKPVTIKTPKGPYYLYLVLDLGDTIHTGTNINDLQEIPGFKKEKVRPLTWIEMMYVAVYSATRENYVHITRYPVIGDGSVYPSKIHLCSTIPGRIVTYSDRTYPEYPILGNAYQDSVQVGFDRLEALVGDFDGDTVSVNGVMSEEAKEECKRYLESTHSVINAQKRLIIGELTKTAKLSLYNWTR